MQLAIFDLDHTLIPFDSDKAWNQFLIDIDAVEEEHYRENNERFYQDYLNADLDIRAYQRFACEILQTHPIDQVTAWRDQYVQEIVRPQLQTKALECIQSYKIEGFHTLIISATNTFIVQPIACLHGVDSYLGCEFEVIDGTLHGRVNRDPNLSKWEDRCPGCMAQDTARKCFDDSFLFRLDQRSSASRKSRSSIRG